MDSKKFTVVQKNTHFRENLVKNFVIDYIFSFFNIFDSKEAMVRENIVTTLCS